MSVLLRIAYDGADFHGFARQPPRPDGRPIRTVQGALEAALSDLYRAPITVRGASRTDAGVHARGQLCAFDPPTAIPARGVVFGLRARLPADLAALSAWEEVDEDGGPIEPRHQNLGKHYRYTLRCAAAPDPIGIRYAWHLGRDLDLEAMAAAARLFCGEHDFAAFRSRACQAQTTIRRLRAVEVTGVDAASVPHGDPAIYPAPTREQVIVDVRGEAFLHNMVRILVGTLAEVGLGRRAAATIEAALARGDRRDAGVTAPAAGLTLMEVLWDREAVKPGRRARASEGDGEEGGGEA